MQLKPNTTRLGKRAAAHFIAAVLFVLVFSFPKSASALGCDIYAALLGGSEDACVNAVGHWSEIAVQFIKAQADARQTQMLSDNQKLTLQEETDAQTTSKSYVAADISTTCAVTMAAQAHENMRSFSDTFATIGPGMMGSKNTGSSADATSLNAKTERVCELSEFICPQSNRYGPNLATIVQNCPSSIKPDPCPQGGLFADADINEESLLKPRQFVIPPTSSISRAADGHILIQTSSSDNESIKFKAAWEVCENAALMTPTPPHTSGTPTAQFIGLMADERPLALLTQGSVSKCFEFFARRVACPATTSDFTFGGAVSNVAPNGASIQSCHDAQVAMCHRLKDPPPGGVGLGSTASADQGGVTDNQGLDAEAVYAFANCDKNGLSLEMADYIYSHRCMNTPYVTTVIPGDHRGDVAEAEKAAGACREEAFLYDRWLEDEKANVKESFRQIALMRGQGIGVQTNTAQPVQGSGH